MTNETPLQPADMPPGMPSAGVDIRQAITPLRLIFWGGLICVVYLRINEFDLLNDFVGMILITIGVFRLAKYQVNSRYKNVMLFVQVTAVLATMESLATQFDGLPEELSIPFSLLGLVALVAIVYFCAAMRILCRHFALDRSERSWGTTKTLFIVIYLIPLGIFYLIALGSILAGKSFHVNLGAAALLLIPVFVAPLVHLFISTSRMKSQAAMS